MHRSTYTLLSAVLCFPLLICLLMSPPARAQLPAGFDYTVTIQDSKAVIEEAPGVNTPGFSVSISGDVAVVGVPWRYGFKGAAYVYERRGGQWFRVHDLTAPELGRYDHFGASVSIDGDVIVVGAPWHDNFRGGVWIYRYNGATWTGEPLAMPAARPEEGLGQSVTVGQGKITVLSRNGSVSAFAIDGSALGKVPGETAQRVAGAAGRRDAAALATLAAGTEILPSARMAPPPAPANVNATDLISETEVQVRWSPATDAGTGEPLDAVVYKILRDGILLSVVSSVDSLYGDATGLRRQNYTYCVVTKDLLTSLESDTTACDDGSRTLYAPGSLAAAKGDADDHVRLSWVDRSTVEVGYIVRVDSSDIQVRTASVAANATAYNDSAAATGVPYTYRVFTLDGDGQESLPSEDFGFTVDVSPPGNVQASDGLFPDRVRVTWQDRTVLETGYVVARRATDDTVTVVLDTVAIDVTAYDDFTATSGKTYQYCVKTIGPGSIDSIWVCDEGTIDLPPALDVQASDLIYDDRVHVSWDYFSELEDGFVVLRDNDSIATLPANTTTFADFGATPDSTHNYCVRAFTDSGSVSPDECDTGVRITILAPANVTASDGSFEDRTNITWESTSTTVALFTVYRDSIPIKTLPAFSRSYQDYEGVGATTYLYYVTAVTSLDFESSVDSTGSDSGYRQLNTPAALDASDNAFEDKVEITWVDNSAFEDGYHVYGLPTDSLSAFATSSQAGAVPVLLATLDTGRDNYTHLTGVPGVKYTYSVVAFDSIGGGQGASATATDEGVRTLKAPGAAMASDTFEDRVEITWTDESDAENGYRIYRSGVAVGSTADNTTSFVDYPTGQGAMSVYDTTGQGIVAFFPGETEPLEMHSVFAYGGLAFAVGDNFFVSSMGDTLGGIVGIDISKPSDPEVPIGPGGFPRWIYIRDPADIHVAEGYAFTTNLDEMGGPTPGWSATHIVGAGAIPNSDNNYATGELAGIWYQNMPEGQLDLLVVAKGSGGVEMWDYDIAGIPSFSAKSNQRQYQSVGDSIVAVTASGNFIYGVGPTTAGEGKLTAIDTSGVFAGEYSEFGRTFLAVVTDGSYAYLAGDNGVNVIDVSDPADPILTTLYGTPAAVTSVDRAGDRLFATLADGEVWVWDISEPTQPEIMQQMTLILGGVGNDLSVAINGAICVATDIGLITIPLVTPGALSTDDYNVVAFDGSGESLPSSDAGTTVLQAPSSFGASNDYHDYIRLTWVDESMREDGYVIYRDGRAIDTVGPNVTVYEDTDIAPQASSGAGGVPGPQAVFYPESTFEYCVQAYTGATRSQVDCDIGGTPAAATSGPPPFGMSEILVPGGGVDVDDQVGEAVDIDGNRAVVGVPGDNQLGDEAGAVYVFERVGDAWEEKQKLIANMGHPGAAGDKFGSSVAISGDWIVVGAPHDDGWAGRVYLFERDGNAWVYRTDIVDGSRAANDLYGFSVDIDGDYVVVGVPQEDNAGNNSGSFLIYEKGVTNTWVVRPPELSGPAAGAQLGWSVAIADEGDVGVVIAGAPFHAGAEGYVVIHERDPGAASGTGIWNTGTVWTFTGTGVPNRRIGESVALSGDGARAVLGAHDGFVGVTTRAGGWSGYEYSTTLSLYSLNPYIRCDIDGDRFVVGTLDDYNPYFLQSDNIATSTGAVAYFEYTGGTWDHARTYFSTNTGYGTLGDDVAIAGDFLLAGDDVYQTGGRAYVVDLAPVPPTNVTATDGGEGDAILVRWDYAATAAEKFLIYRDDVLIEDDVDGSATEFRDVLTEPGRSYHYCVVAFADVLGGETEAGCDFGRRSANGSIAGRISTPGGGVENVAVCLTPTPASALLLDGWGGHAATKATSSELASLNSLADFTVEAWVKYTGSAGDPLAVDAASVIRQGGALDWAYNMDIVRGAAHRIRFRVNALEGELEIYSSADSTLNDGQWHHVACAGDQSVDSLFMYVDGVRHDAVYLGSLNGPIFSDSLRFGDAGIPGTSFQGQIDDVRIWAVTRPHDEIVTAMTTPLSGSEVGLLGYWKLDDGAGADGDNAGLIANDATGLGSYATLELGAYWSEDPAPLDYCELTDDQGNFTFNQLRYGETTTFDVRPTSDARQFEPVFSPITISKESPVQNQVGFSDISQFEITGRIRFAGVECDVSNVEILVDGQVRDATDSRGKFSVFVDEGEHSIRPRFSDHTFVSLDSTAADTVKVMVNDDVAGVDFANTTTHTVLGRVGGGCDRYVGDITITFRAENNCQETTVMVDSTDFHPDSLSNSYSLNLPPQVYLARATVDENTIPAGLPKVDVIRFFEGLGERQVDLTDSTDVHLDFIYRAPLSVAIEGFEGGPYEGCQLTLPDGTPLPAGTPVVPQFVDGQINKVIVTIRVNEIYGPDPSDVCPLDTAMVLIFDGIAEVPEVPDTAYVSGGVATYEAIITAPSLVEGRTDAFGNNRSFQKDLTAQVFAEGKAPVSETIWALVTGHVKEPGANFVTYTSELPLFILRDPPGDGSYAYLEKGYKFCKDINWTQFTTQDLDGYDFKIAKGFDLVTFFGLGGGKIDKFQSLGAFNNRVLIGGRNETIDKTHFCMTTVERLQTHRPLEDDPLEGKRIPVGADADVFVGAGVNMVFAEVGVIEVDTDCNVLRSTSLGSEVDSIATAFVYTAGHVRNVLIPELKSLADISADSTLAARYRAMASNWKHMLARNDTLKQAAYDNEEALIENRSFSSGAQYEYSSTIDTTRSVEITHTFVRESEIGGGIDLKYPGFKASLKFPSVHKHEEIEGHPTDVDTTRSLTIGYVLKDDDIGDYFSVDVMEDNAYATLIFQAVAGKSSCPYEPWPLPLLVKPEDAEASMQARDAPGISITPQQLFGVPPDEPGVFKVAVQNNSDEAREYVVSSVSVSNPAGAILRLNGSPIAGGLTFTVAPQSLHEATLTVARGPTRYDYDGIELLITPACFDPTIEDRVTFDVQFIAPCSDITLERPRAGWSFDAADQAMSNPILVLLADYDLMRGAVDENLGIDAIGIEYRHMGVGRDGPGPWGTVYADTVGENILNTPPTSEIHWLPNDSLPDGVYEMRAFTECGGPRGYSAEVTGTIDRNAPVALGTPGPSDGELSFGEDISVSFSEAVDCDSIDPDSVSLYYVDGPLAGQAIATSTVCDANTIVLVPTVASSLLEGRRLRASVAGVSDLLGTPLLTAIEWEFEYRQSLFTWGDTSVDAVVNFRAGGSLTGTLVNGTPSAADYTIASHPEWLVPVNSSGTVPPGASRAVAFSIADSLSIGIHTGQVFAAAADTTQGTAVLDVYVEVRYFCDEPVWAFDPSGFQRSMTIVTQLEIESAISTDRNDRVAAFVGNELRGVASLDSVPHYGGTFVAFLSVYSDRLANESVRFEIWDDDTCRHYNNTLERYTFVADGIVGTPEAPVLLTATDALPDTVGVFALNAGWNWFSTNVKSGDMRTNTVLSSLNPAIGDMIKSKTESAVFDPDLGWVGTLDTLENCQGYMIRLTEAGTVLQGGAIVDPDSMPLPLASGWNWISYVPRSTFSVPNALDDLNPVLSNGDLIKNDDGFSQYVNIDAPGWYGSLDSLRSGSAYNLYVANAGVTSEFNYPTDPLIIGGSPGVCGATVPAMAAPPAVAADGANSWYHNPNAYEHNMVALVVLNVDGGEWRAKDYRIGAFVDNECRGITAPIYLAGLDRYVAFLTVHGNEIYGEDVELQAIDSRDGARYDIDASFVFAADEVMGTLREPIVASGEIARPVVPTQYALRQNYPNPFNADDHPLRSSDCGRRQADSVQRSRPAGENNRQQQVRRRYPRACMGGE